MNAVYFRFEDEAATGRWAAALAQALAPIALAHQGFAIHLIGDLGSGKTTLVRYLLAALGIPGPVKSPSYALLEPYNVASFGVYHFDLYRFSSPDQWSDAGFDDVIAGPGLMLVEWPEQAQGALPPPDLRIALQWPGDAPADEADSAPSDLSEDLVDGRRLAVVNAESAVGQQCLNTVTSLWSTAATG